jgi:glycosyltransferase involved in cell wall biosynthesis
VKSAAPLRVTVLTGDFYPDQVGGQGIYAYEVATRAAALGVDVSVVCLAAAARISHRYPDGLRVRFIRAGNNVISYTAALERVRRDAIQNADVVHVNELYGFSASLLRSKKRGLVVSSHNSYLDRFHAARGLKKLIYPPLIALERLSYPRADRLIIGSEIERAPARSLGVDDNKIRLIPYGVDALRFSDPSGARRAATRARLGLPEGARVGLFVGRFVERKKPHVVARAFRELAAEDPNFQGLLVGDGPMMPAVREVIGNETRIRTLGAVPFSELHEYYAAADVFTLPSVGEGSISLVVLEAAAAGLPLVLTEDSCGQSAVFEAGKNGELVTLDDVRGLAQGLRAALARQQEFGSRSRTLVEAHFSWDACARQTVDCYREVARR